MSAGYACYACAHLGTVPHQGARGWATGRGASEEAQEQLLGHVAARRVALCAAIVQHTVRVEAVVLSGARAGEAAAMPSARAAAAQ